MNIKPDNPLYDARCASLVRTLQCSPSLADSIRDIRLSIEVRESRQGSYVADILPLVKHARILNVRSVEKGRIMESLSPSVRNSLRVFWSGPQGYQLTHLTLEWILGFPFSELHVPNLLELKLVYVYGSVRDDKIDKSPQHQLKRLVLDQFDGGDLKEATSLQLFIGNSVRPLDSLIFKLALGYSAKFTVFGAIDGLLGQRKTALRHFRLDYPEVLHQKGYLASFDLPVLESLQVFELRMELHEPRFLVIINEWIPSQLQRLPSMHPFRLLDIQLPEPLYLGFSKWMKTLGCAAWHGFDRVLCEMGIRVQVTFLLQNFDRNRVKTEGWSIPVISSAIQQESEAFVKRMLPDASNQGLVVVYVSFDSD
ncbi:hypothetical protein DL96DRAFT_1683242 [Flagelloscypha sp. PMI_526]|nr:hypothetical protein DL96DRAFT_1683242 [Flagelloscypha sp. PMI_526]